MPVPAVSLAGRPTVSSGSAITSCGIIFGWKITFLVWVSALLMTEARPVSEPVPAVVGTAIDGWMPAGLARVYQSPISSKSHSGRVWPAMKAMALPVSMPEPPPHAMTPSCLPARSTRTPGLDFTSLNTATSMPAFRNESVALEIIGSLAKPGSVTSSGRLRPTALQASGSSRMRPAPKRMEVGKLQLPKSGVEDDIK